MYQAARRINHASSSVLGTAQPAASAAERRIAAVPSGKTCVPVRGVKVQGPVRCACMGTQRQTHPERELLVARCRRRSSGVGARTTPRFRRRGARAEAAAEYLHERVQRVGLPVFTKVAVVVGTRRLSRGLRTTVRLSRPVAISGGVGGRNGCTRRVHGRMRGWMSGVERSRGSSMPAGRAGARCHWAS